MLLISCVINCFLLQVCVNKFEYILLRKLPNFLFNKINKLIKTKNRGGALNFVFRGNHNKTVILDWPNQFNKLCLPFWLWSIA